MDRKKLFRSIEGAVRSLDGLPEAMEKAGFNGKDIKLVGYMVSGARDELAEAIGAEDSAVSEVAISRISDELSLEKGVVRSLVRDMREAIHGPKKKPEKTQDDSALTIKNAGNNAYIGGAGFVFRPMPSVRNAYFLAKYVGEETEIRVPEKVRMGRVEGTVTGIGENAFRRTAGVSIILPKTISSIGANAFEGCERLRSVSIPPEIDYIGAGAFRDCPQLESIELGKGCAKFRSNPDGIIYSADGKSLLHVPGAISGHVDIDSGTEKIADSAFWGCGKIESVSIPDGVTSIGTSAFTECSGLKTIELPASLESMGEYAFGQCDSLGSITVAAGSAHFSSEGGVLYSKDGKTLIRFPGGISGSFEVPNGVEIIGKAAFSDCEGIKSVSMGSVIEIGDDAFRGCSELGSAELGQNLVSLGKYSFMGCASLRSIFLPDSVRKIGTWVFGECSSLTEASIPDGLETNMTSFPETTRVTKR
ncbi:MAG: leucine-rich repeat domain-containing protein [Candidatus Methanomethylophilaceae archaeon]|nr:leucine-rich repeat domain-containing protein [Candidatus Methanomethylophilaceae archaeon]